MIYFVEEDRLGRKVFKVFYEDITFGWEELDIKLFEIIFNSFPVSFAIHNDFLENDRDKISYEKFINTYKCFIGIYEVEQAFLKEKLKRKYISIAVNDSFFKNPFGTYWYLLFGKYEQLDYMWNSICNFGYLEKTNFESFINPYIEKNFINGKTVISLPANINDSISKIRKTLLEFSRNNQK